MRYFALIAIGLLIVPGCGDGDDSADSPAESNSSAATTTTTAEPNSVASTDDTPQPETDAPTVAVSEPEPDVATKPDVADADARTRTVDAKIAEYDEAMKEFRTWYTGATDEEKQASFQDKYPKAEEYASALMEVVNEDSKDAASAEALSWIITRARGEMGKKATDLMFENHLKSDKIGDIVTGLSRDATEKTEKRLRQLMEVGASPRVKGLATFTLASFLKNNEKTRKAIEENPAAAKYYKDSADYLANFKADPAAIEKLYETAVSEFGTVSTRRGTLADAAGAALFEMRNLQIGMDVPDIVAADLDGVEFKLSDYRGKVVMLDFWGNW